MLKTKITPKERYRLKKLHKYENELYEKGYNCIAGVDEVGIGPLAGPVVAAACILPKKFIRYGINDSKKLSFDLRESIYQELINHSDVIYNVAIVDHKIIDQINIFQARLLAMKQAIQGLANKPDYLLIDGKHHPIVVVQCKAIIGGDALSISIAAASIIAKQTRDRIMDEYHEKFPNYGFISHKGYATQKHKQALIEHGPCEIHRRSYAPVSALFS